MLTPLTRLLTMPPPSCYLACYLDGENLRPSLLQHRASRFFLQGPLDLIEDRRSVLQSTVQIYGVFFHPLGARSGSVGSTTTSTRAEPLSASARDRLLVPPGSQPFAPRSGARPMASGFRIPIDCVCAKDAWCGRLRFEGFVSASVLPARPRESPHARHPGGSAPRGRRVRLRSPPAWDS